MVYIIKVIEQKTVTETVACISEESEPGMVKAGASKRYCPSLPSRNGDPIQPFP